MFSLQCSVLNVQCGAWSVERRHLRGREPTVSSKTRFIATHSQLQSSAGMENRKLLKGPNDDTAGVDEIKSDSSDTSVQACKRHQRTFPSLLQREEGADAQLHTCLCATIIIILWCSLLLEYCTDSPSSSSSTPTPCLSEWD